MWHLDRAYVSTFTLRRPNVSPTGDYGIQAAMKHYKMPKPEQMEKIAKAWAPAAECCPAGICGEVCTSRRFRKVISSNLRISG